jgi:hypothetical protein
MMGFGWMRALGTITGVLTWLVLLIGFIVALVAYLRKGRSKVALLGTIGFLLMFLLSCCSLGWGLADQPILRELPSRSTLTYGAIKQVVLFLLGLVNLVGLALIASAVWSGGKKG